MMLQWKKLSRIFLSQFCLIFNCLMLHKSRAILFPQEKWQRTTHCHSCGQSTQPDTTPRQPSSNQSMRATISTHSITFISLFSTHLHICECKILELIPVEYAKGINRRGKLNIHIILSPRTILVILTQKQHNIFSTWALPMVTIVVTIAVMKMAMYTYTRWAKHAGRNMKKLSSNNPRLMKIVRYAF